MLREDPRMGIRRSGEREREKHSKHCRAAGHANTMQTVGPQAGVGALRKHLLDSVLKDTGVQDMLDKCKHSR